MLGYRSYFQVEQGKSDILGLIREQLHSWLRSKDLDGDALVPGKTAQLAEKADGVLLEENRRDGSYAQRTRISEHRPQGIWTTQLTTHIPGNGDPALVWIDVSCPETGGGGAESGRRQTWVGTPRLARQLLDVLDAHDGSARLDAKPRHVAADEVPELVKVVQDERRRGPVYIAGIVDSIPFARWSGLVSEILGETVGLGAAFVLDPEATERFAREAGSRHKVAPGTLRTFLPGADFGDESDALRHRVLGTKRIVDVLDGHDAKRVKRFLGWRARELAVEQALPRFATRLDESFEKAFNQVLVGSAPEPAPPQMEPSVLPDRRETAIEYLRSEFGDPGLTIERLHQLVEAGRQAPAYREALAQRLTELQEHNTELQQSQQEVKTRLSDTSQELSMALADLDKEQARTRYLRGLLRQEERWADAQAEPDSDEFQQPELLFEVIDQIGDLEYVEFTGDEEPAFQLDENADGNAWAIKAWQAVRALNDYARAKRSGAWDRDVDGYLRDTPAGLHAFPANRHAPDETSDLRESKFAKYRELPVPEEIDPSKTVFMGAHFKIAASGTLSPRMHYHDGTRTTGKVYIGYLGRHLPSRMTN